MALLPALVNGADLSDSRIRELLIRQSIAAYPGNCPCPYSVNRAGRRCGASSAYSKPGGRSPLCYPQDVTEQMIERVGRAADQIETADCDMETLAGGLSTNGSALRRIVRSMKSLDGPRVLRRHKLGNVLDAAPPGRDRCN